MTTATPVEAGVSLEAWLAAKECRAARQADWLRRYQQPIISLTLVTPGTVKNSLRYRNTMGVALQMCDQLLCKGMQGVHGLFEDEFRARNIHAIWMPHALPDKRNVSRAEIRSIINDYMTTVMQEEPLDPSLLEFDDSMSW